MRFFIHISMGRALMSCLMGQWHILGFYYRWFIFLGWNLILQHSHIYKILYIYNFFFCLSPSSPLPTVFAPISFPYTHVHHFYFGIHYSFHIPYCCQNHVGWRLGWMDRHLPLPFFVWLENFSVFLVFFFFWIKQILLTKRRKIVPIYKIICYIIIVYKN